jgi:DNA-binding beta-propeller fold protein YncE
VTDLTISSDGATLYAAATSGIVMLGRDLATGNLTPKGCLGYAQNCTGVDPSLGSLGLAVSPDDASVYSRSLDTLTAFDRISTGLLTAITGGCIAEREITSCTHVSGLEGPSYQLAVSPDGATVYVPSADGVAVLAHNPSTMRAYQAVAGPDGGCVTHDGSSTHPGECETLGASGPALEGASAAAVTPWCSPATAQTERWR